MEPDRPFKSQEVRNGTAPSPIRASDSAYMTAGISLVMGLEGSVVARASPSPLGRHELRRYYLWHSYFHIPILEHMAGRLKKMGPRFEPIALWTGREGWRVTVNWSIPRR